MLPAGLLCGDSETRSVTAPLASRRATKPTGLLSAMHLAELQADRLADLLIFCRMVCPCVHVHTI